MGDQCSSGAIIGHVGISFSVQCAGEWHRSFWSRLQWTTLIGVAFFGDAQSANLTPCLNWLSWGFYSEKYIKAARTSLSRYPYRERVTAPDAESWLWPSCESICGYNRRSWVIHVACPMRTRLEKRYIKWIKWYHTQTQSTILLSASSVGGRHYVRQGSFFCAHEAFFIFASGRL